MFVTKKIFLLDIEINREITRWMKEKAMVRCMHIVMQHSCAFMNIYFVLTLFKIFSI